MGATRWIYYVPYQQNLERVFHDLREQVFQEWLAYDPTTDPDWPKEVEPVPEELVEALKEYFEFFPQNEVTSPSSPPQTIEELLERTGSEGTGSIFDIRRLSLKPREREWEHIPLSPEILQHFFASKTPTREVVEAIVNQPLIWEPFHRRITLNALQPYNSLYKDLVQKGLPLFYDHFSRQQLVELFLKQQEVWEDIYRDIQFELRRIDSSPLIGTAIPFSKEILFRYFGTNKPTHEVVERVFEQRIIWGTMYRNVGYYAVLYEQEQPSKVVFAGFSGD